ncbi:MAG: 3-phosphoshikimate 1-carboxyvinyltransferase [Capsulimonadaceae bacterium]
MPQAYPPQLKLSPVNAPVEAAVRLPGSKSITNRSLLLAAMADGVSVLHEPLHSEDTRTMIDALRVLGVTIMQDRSGDLTVHGLNGRFDTPSEAEIFTGNSGTTIRFLTAAACLMPRGASVILDGVARMRERPIADLVDGVNDLDARVDYVLSTGFPPVKVFGGGIGGGSVTMHGDVSSQFLTAVLMVAPFARMDVAVKIAGELISKPYVDLTLAVMNSFGGRVDHDGYSMMRIRCGQSYRGIPYNVEADASNATYFMAAAAITGGVVRLTNLSAQSIQGDARFVDVLERMGCGIDRGESLTVRGPARLRGIDVDMTAIPDTAQTLAVLCAYADSPSHITGLASLRVKETDRITAIATELTKIGAQVDEGPDYWTITPIAQSNFLPTGPIDTYEDHRMAMSFAIAGLRTRGVVIENPGCVAKTFPDFWARWKEAFGV